MKRVEALVIALAATLTSSVAYAAPALPEIHAPRGEDAQAPRA